MSRFHALRASILAIAMVAGSTARAGTINFLISEGTPFDSGVLIHGGGLLDPLIGFDIEVDFLVGNDTPLLDGVGFPCIDCRLNFLTGPKTFADAGGWVFAGGGGVRITGSLDVTGDLVPDIPLVPFALEGFFAGDSIAVDAFPVTGIVDGIEIAAILDRMHPFISALYGMPDGLYEGAIVLRFTGFGEAPGGFLAEVGDGFVINTPIPEPSIVALLFAAFPGLWTLRRRSTKSYSKEAA